MCNILFNTAQLYGFRRYGDNIPFYKAKRIKKATIKQKRPIASERAKPKMAYEKS